MLDDDDDDDSWPVAEPSICICTAHYSIYSSTRVSWSLITALLVFCGTYSINNYEYTYRSARSRAHRRLSRASFCAAFNLTPRPMPPPPLLLRRASRSATATVGALVLRMARQATSSRAAASSESSMVGTLRKQCESELQFYTVLLSVGSRHV